MQRILAIWLPNWPVQRLVNERPELAGRPLLLHGAAGGRPVVVACSIEAQHLGITPQMPLAEASAIGGRRLCIQAHDPLADWVALTKLTAWCRQLSPTVGLEESQSPCALLIDASVAASLWDGEEAFVNRAANHIEQLGFHARLALADTVGLAHAVARYGEDARNTGRQIVLSNVSQAVLASLPLAALRLPESLTETLAALGLQSIGDLLSLPREQLPSRFGRQLLLRVDQALGHVAEAVVAPKEPSRFAVRQAFDFPVVRKDLLDHAFRTLLKKLEQILAAHQAGALRLRCSIHCEQNEVVSFEIGLFQPTASAKMFGELIDFQFERLRLSQPAIAAVVEVLQEAPLRERQTLLLEDYQGETSSPELSALVNRLANRLGRDAVVRCHLKHDAQPELAYRVERLLDGFSVRHRKDRQRLAFGPLDRPLYLLGEALPLSRAGFNVDGLPCHFYFENQRHAVLRLEGPERIETGWWRRRRAGRDYYRLETVEGRRFWSYRRRQDGHWFLHGFF
jgi:protein ImuB